MPVATDTRAADALLAETQRHERGRLKIFLGAAPGVGKTFEMLTQARRKLAEGVDVAVGIVETHGRADTLAQLAGLPQLPRKVLTHRGRALEELDLDAVLARHPHLVLVDELAHSNVPGSRHAKRHQDVQELLDAGIDVYTTLNVQHLESYNDLVERITGVTVRETVPDVLLDLATDVELIDLPPDDLLERLRQGKVYLPDQAQRALENFFSRGNLLALRELALRAAAARVDDELANFMRAHRIDGPWPATGRLLVCIDASKGSEALLRSACRLAEQRHLPWVALYVQTLGAPATDDPQLEQNLALATQLGATTDTITANRVGHGVLEYARAMNAAQIVVGRPMQQRWRYWWRSSLAEWLFHHATAFEVTVIGVEQQPAANHTPRITSPALTERAWLLGIGCSLAATLLAVALQNWLLPDDLSPVFILGVAIAGAVGGLNAALLACVLSFLCFNFFFLPPLYTFTIGNAAHLRALVIFLIVGCAVGLLSGRLQRQEADARRNSLRTSLLFDFMRRLATAINERDLRAAAAQGVADILGMQCVMLSLDHTGQVQLSTSLQRASNWHDVDTAAANWSAQHQELAGSGTATLPASAWTFVPLSAAQRAVAVLALHPIDRQRVLDAEAQRLLFTLQSLLNTALERFELLKAASDARVRQSADNLRAALLASVSHDLRTPLVSVIGSLSTLHDFNQQLSVADQQTLLDTALHEAQRLNRLVENLLDATKLAQGALALQLTAVDLADSLHTALQHFSAPAQQRIHCELPHALPMARADLTLLQHTLINLLDNALKYSPHTSAVLVSAEVQHEWLHLHIRNPGSVSGAQRERLFDFFYRAQPGDQRIAGTGLGLAICKGFVDAMGGRITVHSDANTTCFTVELPLDDTVLPDELDAAEATSP